MYLLNQLARYWRLLYAVFAMASLILFTLLINLASINENSYFSQWAQLNWQTFGFLKRTILPSLFELFDWRLQHYMWHVAWFYYAAIFLVLWLILNALDKQLELYKRINLDLTTCFVFLAAVLCVSPVGIWRLLTGFPSLLHDGLSFLIFLVCFYLFRLRDLTLGSVCSGIVLSTLALLNHEAFFFFLSPVLIFFIWQRNKKWSFYFGAVQCIIFLLIVAFGKAEQFSTLESFKLFALQAGLDNQSLFEPSEGFCNFYPMMPFFASLNDNVSFNQCLYQGYHFKNKQFYLLMTYLALFSYLFTCFLIKNKARISVRLCVLMLGGAVFFVACDVGRWVVFLVCAMCLMMIDVMLQRKAEDQPILLSLQIKLLMLGISLFTMLGPVNDWSNFLFLDKVFKTIYLFIQ